MFNFHTNHKVLLLTAFFGFLFLSIFIAVVPAYQMQKVQPLPNQPALTEMEFKGQQIYISEGCVACHTQQVRNIEMDNVWGKRPSMPSDYFYSKQRMDTWRQSPSLLGSERTGPDLTDIGNRQPSQDWHLMHLYNPRSVVEASIMPSYPWMFEMKNDAEVDAKDVVVPLGMQAGKKIVANEKTMQLVAYLQSLKQHAVAESMIPAFIPAKKDSPNDSRENQNNTMGSDFSEGATLYANTCAACHQVDGQGILGAFPPLAGSDIVNNEDPDLLVRIILQGYDARSEYGIMPSFMNILKDEEVAAIVNHEKTSWGNQAPEVSVEEVAAIRASIELVQ